MVRIGFHGAAETVTGSRHLLEIDGKRVLVDCGLFQGRSDIRERNWAAFPVDPSSLDAVVITHAHMDHIGWLPRLVAQGYEGPIFATKSTIELARISLPDSGRLQEEEADRANRKRTSRHHPALPLYTERMAYECLKRFEPKPYNEMQPLPGGAVYRFLFAGHIMGSAFAEIYFPNGERILMSGDLGRFGQPIINDPTPIDGGEYLVVESTYGDRLHSSEDPKRALETILNDTFARGCCLLVPSFAIGRTQDLLYYISELQEQGRVPRIPIFVDSPMATSVTNIYERSAEEHDEEMRSAHSRSLRMLEPRGLTFIRDREQSKMLNAQRGPMMVISGSGMANGGRIVHHLLNRLGDTATTVLFTGYQAEGTLGRSLIEGAKQVRIMGQDVMVRATVKKLNSLSAHADQADILKWLGNFKMPPRKTFVVHGEPPAQAVLAQKIRAMGWNVEIPRHGQEFEL